MLRLLIKAVPVVICLMLLFFFWRGLYNNPHEIMSPLLNHAVPKFIKNSILHKKISVTEKIFLGNVSVLSIFASWCQYCLNEHNILMSFTHESNLRYIGLVYQDKSKRVLNWLDKYGNPFDEVIADDDSSLAIDLGVYGVPETFIIDQKGIIRFKYVGALTLDVWQKKITPLLASLSNK